MPLFFISLPVNVCYNVSMNKDLKYNMLHRIERRELARTWRIKNKEKKRLYDAKYGKIYYQNKLKNTISFTLICYLPFTVSYGIS